MIRQQIEKLTSGENLTFGEAHQAMLNVMHGEVNQAQIAAMLVALKCKGETDQEIAGFARAMRDKSVKLPVEKNNAVDLCGTGGDGSGSFNISTAAAFVVAATGVSVAKHGNRSVSSQSGSADVLQELGIRIDLSPEISARALEEVGFTFLFAPAYHPAMKHVAPVRKELGMKTVFNILGPLTNPAGTRKQLIGTFNREIATQMSSAAALLDMEHICFVCTNDEFDEISLSAPANIIEYKKDSDIQTYILSQDDFGLPHVNRESLRGGSPKVNARIIEDLFKNPNDGPVFYVTVANAAMALYTAGYTSDIKSCVRAAEDSIRSGNTYKKLESIKEFINDNS
jgi:anthranilate phosphoribosyltransferase